MTNKVILSRRVMKRLPRLPRHIASKLKSWIGDVERFGIDEVRKVPGYHDEPLHGKRRGQRSIRLSRSYRAIYREHFDNLIEFIFVEEVNKHDY